MDVEERLRASMTSIIKSEMPCEMKTEPPFDHEKENCDDVSDSSSLVIDFVSVQVTKLVCLFVANTSSKWLKF